MLAVDCALNIHYILWISVSEQVSATSATARLAQSVERKALNLVVVGSSPTVGAAALCLCFRAVGICHLNQAGLSLMWSVQLQGH